VVSDGRDVTPRSRRALDVLAVLLLRRGQVVDPQRILDLVWGHDALDLTPAVVHTVVARLRRSLGASAVETTPTGYRLGPASLDSDEFVSAVETPGRESPLETVERLRSALALWRGPTAYADFDATLLTAEGTRLEELRALARHHLVDALLEGHSSAATAEALGLAEARVAEDTWGSRRHGWPRTRWTSAPTNR
jgi:DNA-binding SARP family transcriptional activator